MGDTIMELANNSLVPYIVRRYKILALNDDPNVCEVVYTNKLSDDDKTQLEGFIGKDVVFKKQVRTRDFWKMASQIYPEVSFNIGNEEDEEDEEVEESMLKQPRHNKRAKKQEPEMVDEDAQDNRKLDLSSVTTEDLVNEIRSRQKAIDAEAVIEIRTDRSVGFEFTKLAWPNGRFKTSLKILEELPIPEPTQQDDNVAKAK